MSKNANPHSALAVGYVRRSTDKQEMSLDEQIRAVQEYAASHGYTIVRWYKDDAISGDDTENRHDFQRMLADAQERRDFRFILCWDQSRFGRFSPQEAGFWTFQFSRAGVGLVTVDKGAIDWNDFTGWLTYSVNQHSKHDFLRQLSKDVVRGQKEAADKGSWLGAPPYGYRVEGTKKNKRLVADDEGKLRVVRRIFREFVDEGRSMADIARRLEDEGIVAPGGGMIDPKTNKRRPWRYDSVRTILENPAYTGDYVSGRQSYAKYHTARGETVDGARKSVRNSEAKWVVRRDTHEAVIDRDTFHRARELLAGNKTGHKRFTPETNPFCLNGILRCGKCGSTMWGDTVKGRKFYRCGNWQTNGPDVCENTKVDEPTILSRVADHLEAWLGIEADALSAAAYYGRFKPADRMSEAFEKVKTLLLPPVRPKRDRERLKKQSDQLAAKLAKARGNLALLDAENIPAAQELIREMSEEQAAIERELQESKPPAEQTVNDVVEEVLGNLYAVANCFRSMTKPTLLDGKGRRGVDNGDGTATFGSLEMSAPHNVRKFLKHIASIIVHTKKSGEGTATRYEFVGGEILFRGVGGSTTRENLHNRVS